MGFTMLTSAKRLVLSIYQYIRQVYSIIIINTTSYKYNYTISTTVYTSTGVAWYNVYTIRYCSVPGIMIKFNTQAVASVVLVPYIVHMR